MKKFCIFVVVILLASMMLSCEMDSVVRPGSGLNTEPPSTTAEQTETALSRWTAVLYFAGEQGMKVVREEQVIEFEKEPAIEDKAAVVMKKLINADSVNDLTTCIPQTAFLRSVTYSEGILVVDMSGEFENDHVGGSTGIEMTMAPIVLSLTEIKGVQKVRIRVEGRILDDFKGHISMNKGFRRDDYTHYLPEK